MSGRPAPPELAQFLSLSRYFSWCEMQRTYTSDFRLIFETDLLDNMEKQRGFMHLSYWYAGLYVVCEAWQELKYSDPDIDQLLQSQYLDVLRRYRNGVFHYQQEYFDTRIKEGIQAGEPFRKWVNDLMLHLRRYLDEWFVNYRLPW
jgi:hypothetical protein